MEEIVGNVLILQAGIPSNITNAILAELIKKSLNYGCIEEIFGCIGGFGNLLNEQFVDLASQQQKTITRLTGMPGAGLRTLRNPTFDPERAMSVIEKNNIRFVFVIGDSSAIDACEQLSTAAKDMNYDIRVIFIPTCEYNSIQLTDHCLGFGSMAKKISSITKNVITRAQSQQSDGAITIVEIAGCEDEWLLSSAALARGRRDSGDLPNIVILSRFDEETFIKNVHQSIKSIGNCAVVVGSKLCDASGKATHTESTAADHIRSVASANFDVDIDVVTLHNWVMTSWPVLSQTDVEECELCAKKAIELAAEMGISGKMITLLRAEDQKYASEASCVEISNVSGKKKTFPADWYSYGEMMPDIPFFKYAAPLMAGEVYQQYENGIPAFAKLI